MGRDCLHSAKADGSALNPKKVPANNAEDSGNHTDASPTIDADCGIIDLSMLDVVDVPPPPAPFSAPDPWHVVGDPWTRLARQSQQQYQPSPIRYSPHQLAEFNKWLALPIHTTPTPTPASTSYRPTLSQNFLALAGDDDEDDEVRSCIGDDCCSIRIARFFFLT